MSLPIEVLVEYLGLAILSKSVPQFLCLLFLQLGLPLDEKRVIRAAQDLIKLAVVFHAEKVIFVNDVKLAAFSLL